MKEKYTIFENFKLLSVSQGLTGKMTGMPAITSSMLCNENCQKLMQIKGSVCEKCYTKKYLSARPSVNTCYKENVYHIWNTIEEMERALCKTLDVDEDDFDEFNEIHIEVDDYYEYLAYRRMILDFTPILK